MPVRWAGLPGSLVWLTVTELSVTVSSSLTFTRGESRMTSGGRTRARGVGSENGALAVHVGGVNEIDLKAAAILAGMKMALSQIRPE